ncbi:MAG: hypothetical protein H6R01_910 [Burkholderiaceae bacterium]|nr:hypothetical protein [Burkholderiaceae bacterium]
MSTENKKPTKHQNSDKPAIKVKPTIFPLGFSVVLVDEGSIIVEFLDTLNGVTTIIESVALPKEKAKALASALAGAIDDEES